MTIKDLKVGDLFSLRMQDLVRECNVWIRGNYDRSTCKYSITNYADSCKERFVTGSTLVNTDFFVIGLDDDML